MKNSLFFKNRFSLLKGIWHWIFRPKKWIGKEVKYYGQIRKVTEETFDSIKLEGVDHFVNKRNYKKLNEQLTTR